MNTHILSLLLLACLSNNLAAQYCTNDNRFSEQVYFSTEQLFALEDTIYASALNAQGVMQDLAMDIYAPKLSEDELEQRPFIMLIHGGGLVQGSKNNMRGECVEFAKRGFVCSTISYRLGSETDSGIELVLRNYRARQDAHAALRFMVDKADQLAIDTSWMFIGGISAGSNISSDLIYTSQAEWDDFAPGISELLGDLDESGNDLTTSFSLKALYNNCGNVRGNNMAIDEMLPMVAFHKEFDNVVPIDTSQSGRFGSRVMHNYLIENEICSELTVDPIPLAPGDGHCPFNNPTGRLFKIGRASCFFKRIFCEQCEDYYATEVVPAACADNLTSTDDLVINEEIMVYPNPFDAKFNVKGLSGEEYFTLFNLSGKVLFRGKNIEAREFAHLPQGTYFLQIRKNTDLQMIKLIK